MLTPRRRDSLSPAWARTQQLRSPQARLNSSKDSLGPARNHIDQTCQDHVELDLGRPAEADAGAIPASAPRPTVGAHGYAGRTSRHRRPWEARSREPPL